MSIAIPRPLSTKFRGGLPWAIVGLSIVLLIAASVFHDTLFHRGIESPAERDSSGLPEPSLPARRLVTLLAPKFEAAGLVCRPAKIESLPTEVAVSGKIEVNGDRSVQIQPRAPGVIREVMVVQGQVVKKGTLLARLDSAEVGTARLNLLAKRRALDTTRIEAQWKIQVADNVKSLIPEIRKNTDATLIEKQYANRPLGTFRALLLQAYAEFDIASHEEIKTNELYEQKIVREHPKFIAVHNRESAQAKIESIIEQAQFDAHQQSLLAEQAVKLAEGEVIDAAERLQILGVPENIERLINEPPPPTNFKEPVDLDLTVNDIVAPFDGTIITKSAVPSQKAEMNSILFHLADLSKVWVSASIPEADFRLIPEFKKGKIRFTAEAYPGQAFETKLLSIGSTINPATRSVSILAETSNDQELFKIDMFVKIALDSKTVENALTIPKSAVVDMEGSSEVFVPEPPAKDDKGQELHAYALRQVKLGRESGDRRVVLSGLSADEQVVCEGAFLLKSEYLLQYEGEED